MSEEEKDNATNNNPEENEAEVVKSEDQRVEVSGELLNEAVTQLRRMAEIRQRDSERQERAIAQMQKTLKRGRILSRYVVFSCLVVMLISVGLAYLMWESAKSEKETATTLVEVNDSLQDATKTIAEETEKQVSTLTAVREQQEKSANELEKQLRETREIQTTVIAKVDEQLGAVREERDNITGEVRSLLEEKTEFYIAKERELEEERAAIKDAKERSKEEQKELINDTIARLNAMAASLDQGGDVTVDEVNEAVSDAEEAIGKTDGDAEITEEMVEDAVEDTAEDTAEVAEDEASGTMEETEAVEEEAEAPAEEAPAEEEETAEGEGDIKIQWAP